MAKMTEAGQAQGDLPILVEVGLWIGKISTNKGEFRHLWYSLMPRSTIAGHGM
jgi:hypothetical protein